MQGEPVHQGVRACVPVWQSLPLPDGNSLLMQTWMIMTRAPMKTDLVTEWAVRCKPEISCPGSLASFDNKLVAGIQSLGGATGALQP